MSIPDDPRSLLIGHAMLSSEQAVDRTAQNGG